MPRRARRGRAEDPRRSHHDLSGKKKLEGKKVAAKRRRVARARDRRARSRLLSARIETYRSFEETRLLVFRVKLAYAADAERKSMDARLHYRRRSRRLRVRVFFARIARVPHRSEVTRSRRSVIRSLTRLSRASKRSSHSARSSAPSPAGEVNSALALRLRALFCVVDEVEIRRALSRLRCPLVGRKRGSILRCSR